MEQAANRMISVIYRYGQRFFTRELRDAGLALDVGQMPALLQVLRCPGIRQEGIAARAGLDKGTVARSLKQLEEGGLVTRCPDPDDRRVNRIFPTQRARELYPRLEEVIVRLHRALYQGLTPQEIDTAYRLLRRMQENMAREVGGARRGSPGGENGTCDNCQG